MTNDLKTAALDYHALPVPGKIRVESTKPCATQQDLALAYTPGVAEPVRAIAADPEAALAPTFGGINLEDIAAPACFEIEAALRERLDIPVFHDDPHGTATIIGAALL